MATTTPQPRPLKVLLTAHPSLDTLDLTGPLEILSTATFTSPSPSTSNPEKENTKKAFQTTITSSHASITTTQGLTLIPHIPISEAYERLAEFDVLVVPGGGSVAVLEGRTEPVGIIAAFADLGRKEAGEGEGKVRRRTRYLLSVCTGSLFLGEAGVLDGLVATTHLDYYGRLEEICNGKGRGTGKGTRVVKERFVVNKLDGETGLRVITSGGVSCGLDSCLWLVEEVAGTESRERVMRGVQYAWREGVVL